MTLRHLALNTSKILAHVGANFGWITINNPVRRNFVVDAAELAVRVGEYAARIAANAPLTVHAAKGAVRLYEQYSAVPGAEAIAALVDACFDSDDYKDGGRAFMDKRTPVFTGK
jgi:enoyl-CoA hydratase/carnithine racemase